MRLTGGRHKNIVFSRRFKGAFIDERRPQVATDEGSKMTELLPVTPGARLRRVSGLIGLLGLLAGPTAHTAADAAPIVHRISGGEGEVHATAFVIEGREGLVLVDSLLTVQGGEYVRAKIRELGKPLEAVVLTHGHPDHYGGLTSAIDGRELPVYAVRGVDDVIRRDDAGKADTLAALDIRWPSRRTFPTHITADSETLTFRDISLTVREIGPAESDFDSVWIMDTEDVPAVFVGDLLTVGEHVYPADGNTANWIGAAAWLQQLLSTDAVLYAGHGDVATTEDVAWVVEYLTRYREEVSRLAEGGVRLTEAEKAKLSRVMIDFVGNDRNARWIEEGADAVAQELAMEGWRKRWNPGIGGDQ
jgi:glyoxylase-like metal-dependent hydrolase (beta-lactamase superfamily II)